MKVSNLLCKSLITSSLSKKHNKSTHRHLQISHSVPSPFLFLNKGVALNYKWKKLLIYGNVHPKYCTSEKLFLETGSIIKFKVPTLYSALGFLHLFIVLFFKAIYNMLETSIFIFVTMIKNEKNATENIFF